ncbi:MAG: hypothetical protein OdinLCB4_007080 [Candidatus Odinarchaeum yellowstonii]|uniref:Uncharacterized protein n=1 Tax=Odinarchaeota yellowstonii (strain LCB_4) TaxID=1841599 RepID=A0AAF0IBC1_ODILC|nr:MAG: hypothetical protein OdinLCB4_007080 [Candidatus Odinarchaeum yellowstonii]
MKKEDHEKKEYILYITEGDHGFIENLIKEEEFFKKLSTVKIFMLAVALGFYYGTPLELTGKKKDYTRAEYLSDDYLALLYAVASCKGGIDVITDKTMVFKIAQEYARGGLAYLRNIRDQIPFGHLTKHIERIFYQIREKIV